MKRRVLAICMAAALCVGLLPSTTLAEAGEYSADEAEDSAEETEVQVANIEIAEDGTATIVLDDAEGEEEQKEEAAETEEPAETEPAGEAEAAEEAEEAEEEEAEPEEVIYTAKDGSVGVKVTAPYGALPDEAELKVERYAKNSKEYQDAAEAIGLDEDETGMAALDISFVADGEEVEPSEAVKVSIDASEILPEDADASTLEVQHLKEGRGGQIRPEVVANDSNATEGTIDEAKATAEFEVESFSAFTVTWTMTGGPAEGTTYTVTVTAYLDGVELDIDDGLTFTSENDELDFETLLSDVGYGTGDYTFSYAIVTANNVTYGSVNNPVVAIEIDQGTGGPTSTTNFLLVYADGTTDTVSTNNVSVNAYYVTPEFGVTIEAAGEDEETQAWVLQAVLSHAGEYASISYDWQITNNDGSDNVYANVTNTDNTGRAYISWASGVEDNTEVTVSVTVTLTLEDGTTATATADYVLEYGDETVDLIMTYGPDKTPLPAGVTVTLTNASGEHVYTGTTDSDGWVHNLEIEPGVYTVTATYTDDEGNTYQCSETVAMHDTGNYSINLNYYDPAILTNVPTRSDWEHIDIKLSVGTTSNSSSGTVSVNITGAQIVGSDGSVKYTATEDSIEGNDNEFQLTFYEGENTTGTPSHSIEFDTGDTIYITYVMTIDGVEQSPVTIAISSSTTYDEGTTYPVTGQRAYKLYNYLYGTSYSSDAQLIADGIGDIDISGMSMMLVAAILCDSSEVTGAGQVQAVSGQTANQWGMDFALSIEALNELAASWAFNIEKTYENASMTAGDFVFYLYNATVEEGVWSLGDLQSTLTNQTSGMDADGNSRDTMELFSIAYSDEAIQAGETYYYILYEQPDTVTSGSGATITFDETIFGVMVQLGTDTDGEATVTATYYRMEQNGDTYTIAQTYTTGTSVDGKITFDSDDYATFEFTNTYQEYVTISGTKVWDDNNNAADMRPTSITINLLKNGEQALDENGDPITVTVTGEGNTWYWSFIDLPVWDGYTENEYSVDEEITVDGYDVTITQDEDTGAYTITNSRSDETEISVEKEWVDNDNAYETRPDSITVTVTGSDESTNTLILSDNNDWSDTLTGLPLYDSTGTEITYTVTEAAIENYDGDVVDNGDGTYTITNTLTGETEISVEKEWLDNDNAYETRPDSITVTITGSDESTYTMTLSDENDWSDTLSELPLYDSTGTEITYTVTEAEIENYDGDVVDNGDGTYTITNTLTGETEVSVTKTWANDSDNKYETRPDSITVTVTGSDGKTYTLTLNEQNSWSATQSELPLYDSTGTEITYKVTEETVNGYTGTVVDNENGTYTITNTLETVDVEGSKTWDDNNNENGNRPESITITLLADDEEFDSVTVTVADNWAWSFTGLPKYQSDGETEVVYTITEDAVTGYDTEVMGYDVTNTTQTTDITVIKVWNDDGNRDGVEPDSVQVQLKAGEENIGEAVTLDEDDKWTYTWEDLPVCANGEKITYTVEEVSVPDGYTMTPYEVDNDGNVTFVVVNTHEDALTQITANKVWQDADNENDTRPDDVTVQLMANGEASGEAVTLDESNGWSYTWKDLYSFEDGELIEYTVEETTTLEGYTTEVGELTPVYDDDNNLTGYTIDVTNTRTGETEITVNKTWVDSDNKYETEPESITVTVTGSDGNEYELTLTAGDGWTVTKDDLPMYDSEGEEITYDVTEETVNGYTGTVDDNDDGTYTITNTLETVDVEGSKTWVDSDNKYSTRPDSITITLLADGEEFDSATVTADDDWAWSFTDLPKYQSGSTTEITYTITEDVVPGYTTSVSDYDVTNTLKTVDISGSKTWENDSESDRPESITIYLYADGKEMTDADDNPITATATSDDGWKWSFEDLPKYQSDGETEIEYTVLEDEVTGYIPTYTYDEDGITITNAIPEIHKDVSDPAYGESTDEDLHEDEADNNDTLEYKMEADHIGGAHDLVLHDFLSDQLDINTLEIQSVTLYADESEGTVLVEGVDYEVTQGDCTADCGLDGCSFEIHVYDEDVENLSADAYVIVIFDIKVQEGVEDFDDYVDEVDNFAGLSFTAFSVRQYAEPDETETYSYGFDIFKYTGSDEPLAGAEFVLMREDEGTYATFEVYDDNTYLLTGWVDSKDDATTIVSGSDGNAVVEGLHDGTFILTETKAPDGYTYKAENTTIVISAADDYSHPTITVDGEEVSDETARIENAPVDEEQIPKKAVSIDNDDAFVDGDKDVNIGDTLTYEISYYNHYSTEATVTITDCLDESLDFVEASDGGTYDEESRTITWTIENATAYAWGSVTFTVTVNEKALEEDEIRNTASVQINDDPAQDTNEVDNPVPETRDISGSKIWDDNDDKADARPDSVTVNLYQNGELYESKTVTEDDDWTWSWVDLPKYDEDNEAYAYTITEDEVEYYTPSYESGSFDITNIFVGEEGARTPTSGPDQGGDHPKTGDTNNLGTWLALLIAAMACLLVGFRMRKRS